MAVAFTILFVFALAFIGANLAPGTDRDQMFWSTFINYQRTKLDFFSLVMLTLHSLIGPALCFSYIATSGNPEFVRIRFLILIALLGTVCLQSYYFFCLVPYYIASFFDVSPGCIPDCSVCVVSVKEKTLQVLLHSSTFYSKMAAIFLAVRPVKSSVSVNSSKSVKYICALFILSHILNEIMLRYSWAESCIHQGFH